jgi:hypothetical protein
MSGEPVQADERFESPEVVTTTSQLDRVEVTGKRIKEPHSFKVHVVGPGGTVILQVSPIVSESRTAAWDNYNITHLPTDIFAYRNTSGRKFGFNVKFVSRTKDEAQENAKYLDLIRGWLLPDFGGEGATPPVLMLYGYNNNNINGVQCILRSYSYSFPDDVDYIYDSVPPMPIIASMTMELDEAYSAEQITAGKWIMNDNRNEGAFEGDPSISGGLSLDSSFPGIATAANAALKGGFPIPAAPISISNVPSSPSLIDNIKNSVAALAPLRNAVATVLQVGFIAKSTIDSYKRSSNLPPQKVTKI